MTYDDIVIGEFVRRLNRFVSEVCVDGRVFPAHVRNTGRCTGVLSPGLEVSLQRSADPFRKTPFTLIAAKTAEYGWVNLDSLSPNVIAGEWLRNQRFDLIRPEHAYGDSRIDYYMERSGERYLMEVKGCTLAKNGAGLFPDAPTKRGAKHLRELAKAAGQGYHAMIAFVIMLSGVETVVPNREIDPEFAEAFSQAVSAGVEAVFIPCRCTPDSVNIA